MRRLLLPLLLVALISLHGQSTPQRDRMDQRIRAAIAGFHATTSLYAKNLDTGESYGARENDRVRTASTIKLAIMATVFDAVAHGRAQWNDPLVMEERDKVGGSGVIRELSGGTHLSIRDLVHMMIVVSDNTATNLLLDRFTAEAVNAEMDKLGLKQTRCLRKILIDGQEPSGFSQAGRLESNHHFGLGVTTPREMVSLLEMMERGELASAEASREMIAILKRQQYKDGIGRRTGDLAVASKSGALDRMRSDAGIVYTPGGRIAIDITCDDLDKVDYSADNAGNIFISELTGILLEGLEGKQADRRPANAAKKKFLDYLDAPEVWRYNFSFPHFRIMIAAVRSIRENMEGNQ